MTIRELVEHLQLEVLCGEAFLERPVTDVYVSDLLSDVLGNAYTGNIWITLHTHLNVVAVAVQKQLSAIVLVGNHRPDADTLEAAIRVKIPLLCTPKSTFETAGLTYQFLHQL